MQSPDYAIKGQHHDVQVIIDKGINRKLQYIPKNVHTVLLWFALLWLCNRS